VKQTEQETQASDSVMKKKESIVRIRKMHKSRTIKNKMILKNRNQPALIEWLTGTERNISCVSWRTTKTAQNRVALTESAKKEMQGHRIAKRTLALKMLSSNRNRPRKDVMK